MFTILCLIIPCLSWGTVSYSGFTVYSITTNADINPEIAVKVGCIFEGVTVEQADKIGLININVDSTTHSISTAYKEYDPYTQVAIIQIPEQSFVLPIGGLSKLQVKTEIIKYIIRRFKGYAEEIHNKFKVINDSKGVINIDSQYVSTLKTSDTLQLNMKSDGIFKFEDKYVYLDENVFKIKK